MVAGVTAAAVLDEAEVGVTIVGVPVGGLATVGGATTKVGAGFAGCVVEVVGVVMGTGVAINGAGLASVEFVDGVSVYASC